MRGLTLTGLAAGLTTVVVFAGCPLAECESNRDCGAAEFCNTEGQCAPLGPPGNGIGEGEGEGEPFPTEGEGEGEPNVDELVDTTVPITMFNRLDDTTALVGVGNAASGLNELREFDLTTGDLSGIVRNFRQGLPGCFLDTVLFLDEADPEQSFIALPRDSETWYSCTDDSVVIEYGEDFAQRFAVPNLSGVEITQLLPVNDGTAGGSDARLLVAARGGNTLREVRINASADNVQTARGVVEVLPGEFSAIMDIIPLAIDGDGQGLGDLMLIMDRSSPPRFVPIQRIENSETWNADPDLFNVTTIRPIELPEETHFALFLEDVGIPDLEGMSFGQDEQNDANIVVVMPELNRGTVRFLRYEVEQANPGVPLFQDLDLQASDDIELITPPANDRVLLEEVFVNGDRFFMYALTTSDHVWRFPLHENQQDNRFNDVRRAQFTNPNDKPLGMIPFPGDPDFVWVGHSNRNFIELLPLEDIR